MTKEEAIQELINDDCILSNELRTDNSVKREEILIAIECIRETIEGE